MTKKQSIGKRISLRSDALLFYWTHSTSFLKKWLRIHPCAFKHYTCKRLITKYYFDVIYKIFLTLFFIFTFYMALKAFIGL